MSKFAVFIEVSDTGWPVSGVTTTEIAEAVEAGLGELFKYDIKPPSYKVQAHLVPEEMQWQQGHLNGMTARDMKKVAEVHEKAEKASTSFRAARTGMQL